MKALRNENRTRRLGALLMALLMILCPAAGAFAAPMESLPPLVFTVYWGEQQNQSVAVTEPGYENSYWLYLPPDVFYDTSSRLAVSDSYGQYARIALEGGPDLSAEGVNLSEVHYLDAANLGMNMLNVLCYDAMGQLAAQYGLYLSLQTPTPVAPMVQPVDVTIMCVDADTNETIYTTSQTCAPGPYTITAPMLPDYDLVSDGAVNGTVDANGANPAQAVFGYRKQVSAVDVAIVCVDADTNETIYTSAQNCAPGPFTIAAPEMPGYDLVSDGAVKGTVNANGANPDRAIFMYRVIVTEPPVTETPEPATPTPEPAPAVVETTVPVYYVDTRGNTLTQAEASVSTGENYVQLDTDRVSSAYTLTGSDTVRVVVDENGVCAPDSVVFTFIAPVDVTVRYLNYDNEEVAAPQQTRCMAGVTPISANPENLTEGYILADDSMKYVTVDENGADAAEIVFRYGPEIVSPNEPTATPEPRPVLVPVTYRTTTGETPFKSDTVKCLTGENTVTANPEFVPEGYRAESAQSVRVVVDAEGNASPAAVEFLYNVSDMTRSVMVYYRDAQGADVTAPQSVVIGVGSRSVSADPAQIPEGWQIVGDSALSITLAEDGALNPEYLVFTLEPVPAAETEAPATPTPEPRRTVEPIDYPVYDMDAYCYPKSADTPLRSFPADDEGNVIGRAAPQDLTHIDGYVVNSLGETWYVVTSGDQTGFMRDSQVRLLSPEELNALFGTPVPATATPVPETPISDGAYIDRWASLNADSVNFRTEASKKSSSMGKYGKNQKLFIYDSVTVDNEKWYRANINGKDGYMMARYIDLMSGTDSQAFQSTLQTPMPVRTLPPTAVPATPTPTAEPVTPTPTAEPSPTPAPYTGYALTVRAVDLRTGVTVSDTTLSSLPANSLLYLYGQAYVNGVCWNSAEQMSSHASGFVQDDALRRISAEEAGPFLAAMTQTNSPAPPTIKPDPYTGYARTNGSNVMVRNYADEKAEIAAVLGDNEAVWVMGQEYVAGSPYYWEVVQSGKLFGYVRSDQLRMMEPEERAAYEQSLRTAVPETVYTVTVPPVTQTSMSSYGYVTTNNVRLRSGPGTSNTQIRMMGQYAFALVLGSETVDNQLWYHINQAGTDGYVMADYFKVLSLGELSEFLTSDEYRQSAANTAEKTNGGSAAAVSGAITSVEDFNSGVWKNPALVNVTYEPFSNIIATPTPDVEQLASPTPTATAEATPEESASPAPLSTNGFTQFTTPEPNASGSGSGWIWAGLAAVALIGGGAYGYSLYRANQRRAAQRAAQRRQQQQQQARQGGYARPTQQTPAQNRQPQRPAYPQQGTQRPMQPTSVFTPPRTQNAPTQGTPAAGPQRPAAPTNTGASAPTTPAAGNASQQSGSSNPTPTRRRRSDKYKS